jgi:hypothetical protein
VTTKTHPQFHSYNRTLDVTLDGQFINGNTVNVSGSHVDSFSGSDNPYHKRQIRHHVDATTVASGYRVTYTPTFGRSTLIWKNFVNPNQIVVSDVTGFMQTGIPLGVDPLSFDISQADIQARLKFLKKHRSGRTAFQGGVFFGELAETLRMLKSPAKALREGIDQYYGAAKKAAHRAGHNTKKRNAAVAGTYLEYAYGWRPLVSDISSIVDLIKGANRSYLENISASFVSDSLAQEQTDVISMSNNTWECRTLFRGSTSVRYKGAVGAFVEAPPSLAEFVGISFTNFLPTIYELIPYSSLVDYFSNIGGIIDGMCQGQVSLSWGCRTERRTSEVISTRFRDYRPGSASFGSNLVSAITTASDSHSKTTRFLRAPVSSVSVGLSDIRFTIPGVGSPWKWLNIGALARVKSI